MLLKRLRPSFGFLSYIFIEIGRRDSNANSTINAVLKRNIAFKIAANSNKNIINARNQTTTYFFFSCFHLKLIGITIYK